MASWTQVICPTTGCGALIDLSFEQIMGGDFLLSKDRTHLVFYHDTRTTEVIFCTKCKTSHPKFTHFKMTEPDLAATIAEWHRLNQSKSQDSHPNSTDKKAGSTNMDANIDITGDVSGTIVAGDDNIVKTEPGELKVVIGSGNKLKPKKKHHNED